MITWRANVDIQKISEAYNTAWRSRDPDAIIKLHTPDTQFWLHSGENIIEGADAVRARFSLMFEDYPGLSFDVHRTLFGCNHWVLDWSLKYASKKTGRVLCWDLIDLVTVDENGLVVRKDTFLDFPQAVKSMKGEST